MLKLELPSDFAESTIVGKLADALGDADAIRAVGVLVTLYGWAITSENRTGVLPSVPNVVLSRRFGIDWQVLRPALLESGALVEVCGSMVIADWRDGPGSVFLRVDTKRRRDAERQRKRRSLVTKPNVAVSHTGQQRESQTLPRPLPRPLPAIPSQNQEAQSKADAITALCNECPTLPVLPRNKRSLTIYQAEQIRDPVRALVWVRTVLRPALAAGVSPDRIPYLNGVFSMLTSSPPWYETETYARLRQSITDQEQSAVVRDEGIDGV